jgi:heterodisulfide reductase subunit A-like polyferredoxin
MKRPKFIPEFDDIPSDRTRMPELPLEERKGSFEEVELGFSEDEARREASRCLSCRRCIGCGLCLAECDPQAVVYDQPAEDIEVRGDALILAGEAPAFDAARKSSLGYASGADVITSVEFDRLTSPTGPFGGLLVRPFDGEIPSSIAFIQCVGSRDEALGADYCSTVCCSRTISQAERARGLAPDVEVTVFHRGMRPVGAGGEMDLRRLAGEPWARLVRAEVSEVSEDPATGEVRVTWAEGDRESTESFGLVVLAVGSTPGRRFKTYGRAVGLRTNKFGFLERNLGDLIEAGPGLGLAGTLTGPGTAGMSLVTAMAAAGKCLDGSGPVGGGDRETGGGKPAIFACEYGLSLAGVGENVLDRIEKMGCELAGREPYLCYMKGRRAMAEALENSSGLIVLGCHAGSHEKLFETVLGIPGRVRIPDAEALRGGGRDLERNLEWSGEAPETVAASGPVVIVGGGVSGLSAASELLRRGKEVVLVEKAERIGRSLEHAGMAQGAEPETVSAFLDRVSGNDLCTVITEAELDSVESSPRGLRVKIAGGKGRTVEAGAMLLATGTKAFQSDDLKPDGKAISQGELGAGLGKGETPWKRLVMVQCVGARDDAHPYCSRYCCKQALQNALAYKTARPEAEITVVHRGIRVYGFEEEVYTASREAGVEFVEVVGPAGFDPESGTVTGLGLDGKPVKVEGEVVVLSLADASGGDRPALSETTGACLDDLGFFSVERPLAGPFRSSARGVFVCGFARAPVIAEEAFSEGAAAAQAIWAYLYSNQGERP